MKHHLKRRSTDGMLKELFFEFDLPAFLQPVESDYPKTAVLVGGAHQGMGRNWLADYKRLRVLNEHPTKIRETPKCPRCDADGAYSFTLTVVEQVTVEILQGTHEGSFFPQDSYASSYFLSSKLADRLRHSGLTGIEFGKVTLLKEGRIKLNEPTGIEVMNAIGRPCGASDLILAPDVPDACPFCGGTPIICPECRFYRNPCPKCKKLTGIVTGKEDGPDDRRLRIEPAPDALWIVDGKKWDGSDFNANGVITKRALDFLLSIHAAPFWYRPALVDIAGVSDQKRQQIQAVANPAVSK